MVVALIALVVALSGSAVAASTLVKGDSLIKKHSLSGNRLKNNHGITGKQIKISSLGKVNSAKNADNATNATNATTATTAKSAPIAQLTYATSTVLIPATGAPVTVGASCPAGTFVTGGGAAIADPTNGSEENSSPAGRSGWAAVFFNFSGGPAISATVTAICAPAAATAP